MKRLLFAGVALAASTLSALAQTSTMAPATTVAPNNQTAIIQPVTPDVTNPTGFVDRRATLAQILGAGGRVVNMVDYGADPTGTANSCGTPLTNALAALNALPTGGVLYFPRGTYTCNARINWANKPIVFAGDGMGVTVLSFTSATAASAGIRVTQNSSLITTTVRDMTIETTVDQPNNNAIEIVYSYSAPDLRQTAVLANLLIHGSGYNDHYWLNGLYCSGCVFGQADNVTVIGKNLGNPPAGYGTSQTFAGFNLNGQGLAAGLEATTDFRSTRSAVFFTRYGWYISGDSEAAYIYASTAVGVNYGVYHDDFAGSSDPTARPQMPGATIDGFDCAAYFSCMMSKGWGGGIVKGTQLTKRTEGNGDWTAVVLADGVYQSGAVGGSAAWTVLGNQFIGFSASLALSPTGISKGVSLGSSATANQIQSNMAGFVDYFVDMGTAAGTNYITDNRTFPLSGITVSWITGTSKLGIVRGNFPINTGNDYGAINLPNGNTTPSVGASVVDEFFVTNPTPITITNFADGYVGQVITIITSAGKETIASGSGILLNGGVNWQMPPSSTLTLRKETTGTWREFARTVAP